MNKKPRRDCATVITIMLSKIPNKKENVDLIEALDRNREDATYKAPEENIQWKRTQATLIKYIPQPKEDWHFEVLSIFTTMSVDELKRIVAKRNQDNQL